VEGEFGFLDLTPDEICTCFTISDFIQFRRINSNEFLLRLWEKDKLRSKIAEITQRFDRIAFLVATEILSRDDISKRRSCLELFILVAEKCFLMNNFHHALAILAGLNNGAVTRLKLSWAELSYRTKGIYDKLVELLSPLNNFKLYRELLLQARQSGKATFPYLPLYLRDITFAHENPNNVMVAASTANASLPVQLLNFQKLELLGRLIIEIKQFQTGNFQQLVEVDEVIQNFFRDLKIISKEDELYALSYQREPRASTAASVNE